MEIIEDRRRLHQIPELQMNLPKTVSYLTQVLTPLGCEVFSPMESALCAWFDFGQASSIAFRADCDALAVPEQTDLPFASTHPGQMHACGHDGHMAILLELARRLSQKKALPHNVLLIFQPGEETPGGAKFLCQTDIFEKYQVTAVFGLHLWPGLPEGEIFSRKRELMSRSSEINVDITGRSSHLSKAHEGLDAMAAAIKFYEKATQMEQALPEETYRLLKFGYMTAGTVRNAIAAHARLEGSLRAFQDDVFDSLLDGLYAIGKQVESETGCTVTITSADGYPAVYNPEALFDRVNAAVPIASLAAPDMSSEDFSFYQKKLPGMFFFLGLGDTPPLHSATFCFDEQILVKGADFFESLAERFS